MDGIRKISPTATPVNTTPYGENLGASMLSPRKTVQSIAVDKVLQKFENDQILFKMMSNFNNKEFSIEQIVEHMASEIKNNCGKIRGSSTSFVFPNFSCYLAHEIGIILDIERCECPLIFAIDSGIQRVDIKDRSVVWDKYRKTYVAFDHQHKKMIETNYEGRVTSLSKDCCESMISLKSRMISYKNDYGHQGWMNFSDVATCFGFDSMIGIVASVNNFLQNEFEIKQLKEFRDLVFREMDIHLPLFTFDCLTGKLEHFQDT